MPKIWGGRMTLNGGKKKDGLLDEKHRIAVQGIFVGIIIKAGAASLKVTDLLFAFLFCKKINLENPCPSSLAVCCLLISIMKFSEHSNIYLDL